MTRTLVRTALALGLAGVLGATSPSVAAAAPAVSVRAFDVSADSTATRPAGVPANARLVKGSMTLDCASLTPSAKRYADAHHYCDGPGDIRPKDVREGDCGISYLWMWNNDGGYAGMSFGVGSYLGDILHISSHVSWVNWRYGNSGTVDGSGFPWSSTYDRTTEAYTAAGFVTGAYSGSVTLIWGGSCTLLVPTDSADVTW